MGAFALLCSPCSAPAPGRAEAARLREGGAREKASERQELRRSRLRLRSSAEPRALAHFVLEPSIIRGCDYDFDTGFAGPRKRSLRSQVGTCGTLGTGGTEEEASEGEDFSYLTRHPRRRPNLQSPLCDHWGNWRGVERVATGPLSSSASWNHSSQEEAGEC